MPATNSTTSLVWSDGRFSVLCMAYGTNTYYYPMERAGRLGYDHIYYEGDWVFFRSVGRAVEYIQRYRAAKPTERSKLRPYRKIANVKGVTNGVASCGASRGYSAGAVVERANIGTRTGARHNYTR